MQKVKSPWGDKKSVTVVKSKTGKDVTLLNPSQKAAKMAVELKGNVKLTNSRSAVKSDAGLTDAERSYRAGYLAARKDSAKVYKHKKNKG